MNSETIPKDNRPRTTSNGHGLFTQRQLFLSSQGLVFFVEPRMDIQLDIQEDM
jgi:hypothetical protein